MESMLFRALCTTQKTQKNKKWKDCFVRFSPDNRKVTVLEAEERECNGKVDMFPGRVLESEFKRGCETIAAGEELTLPSYLVTLEELCENSEFEADVSTLRRVSDARAASAHVVHNKAMAPATSKPATSSLRSALRPNRHPVPATPSIDHYRTGTDGAQQSPPPFDIEFSTNDDIDDPSDIFDYFQNIEDQAVSHPLAQPAVAPKATSSLLALLQRARHPPSSTSSPVTPLPSLNGSTSRLLDLLRSKRPLPSASDASQASICDDDGDNNSSSKRLKLSPTASNGSSFDECDMDMCMDMDMDVQPLRGVADVKVENPSSYPNSSPSRPQVRKPFKPVVSALRASDNETSSINQISQINQINPKIEDRNTSHPPVNRTSQMHKSVSLSKTPLHCPTVESTRPEPLSDVNGLSLFYQQPEVRMKLPPIPDRFDSVSEYVSIYTCWLIHEIQVQLDSSAKQFSALLSDVRSKPSQSSKNQIDSSGGFPNTASIFRACRNKGVSYYSQCELIRTANEAEMQKKLNWQNKQKERKQKFAKDRKKYKKGKRYNHSDDEEDGSTENGPNNTNENEIENNKTGSAGFNGCNYFLKLLDSKEKEHSSVYGKDDLWIISLSPFFGFEKDNCVSANNPAPNSMVGRPSTYKPISSCSSHNLFIFRSLWHGPASSGAIQLQPVGTVANLSRVQKVFAVRALNVSSELAMIDNLLSFQSAPFPPLCKMLRIESTLAANRVVNRPLSTSKAGAKPLSFALNMPYLVAQDLASRVGTRFNLNEDQILVLNQMLSWFKFSDSAQPDSQIESPVLLVHGVFGSGKSYLLVALLMFLCELFESTNDSTTRILVAASTNVAVDRVLLGLLNQGSDQFARVGSLRKIAKPLLPFVLHENRDKEDTVKELEKMLQETTDVDERRTLQETVTQWRDDSDHKKRLQSKRIVGVTCAATSFEVLRSAKFPIVFLDECSQMVEPQSLLPVARFCCQRLLAVGDPKQLPPPLASMTGSSNGSSYNADIPLALDQTLAKTLFVRLGHNNQYKPVLLRTQYRCHPAISSIANKLFYENQLQDGVKAIDRSCMISQWPALIFFDTRDGKEIRHHSGSFANPIEQRVVIRLLNLLLNAGVPSERIGVIALYKSQCFSIQRAVQESLPSCARSLQVSTVDAFQGAERDIVIVTCCRTNAGSGFLDSPNRINVALTRARRHLLVVGRCESLMHSPLWKQVIQTSRALTEGFIDSTVVLHPTATLQLSLKYKRELEEEAAARESESELTQPSAHDDDEKDDYGTLSGGFETNQKSCRGGVSDFFDDEAEED